MFTIRFHRSSSAIKEKESDGNSTRKTSKLFILLIKVLPNKIKVLRQVYGSYGILFKRPGGLLH